MTATEFWWLIERGQAVGHTPTVWRIAGPNDERGYREGEQWTQDAWEATRYPTREAAQAVVDVLFPDHPIRVGSTASVVEHGFHPLNEEETTNV